MISTLVDQLMRFIASSRKKDGSEAGIETALGEALANAVIHGNHEDASKRVQVICLCNTDGEVWISVRDEGYGFDTYALPDPTGSGNLLATHGRGIYLMRAFMDEFDVVPGTTGGAEIVMAKKLPGAENGHGGGQSKSDSGNQSSDSGGDTAPQKEA